MYAEFAWVSKPMCFGIFWINGEISKCSKSSYVKIIDLVVCSVY